MKKFIITRPQDDGRLVFCGCHFVGNTITTFDEKVAHKASENQWHVEVQTSQEAEPQPLVVDEVKSQFVCEVCGKVCKNALGLNGHKRSHV